MRASSTRNAFSNEQQDVNASLLLVKKLKFIAYTFEVTSESCSIIYP